MSEFHVFQVLVTEEGCSKAETFYYLLLKDQVKSLEPLILYLIILNGSFKTIFEMTLLFNLIGHRHTKKLETGRIQGKWYFKVVEHLAAALSSWSHNWLPWHLNFNEVLNLAPPQAAQAGN